MKKLTYLYVKKQIEKEGYKLLSETYINNRSKLKVQCDKGHNYEVLWSSFQSGRRCFYCNGNKLLYKHIKEQIESIKGYKLLSKSYKNNSTKLKVQCDKGHIYYPTYNNFKQGQRCSKCCKYISGLTYQHVKKQIEKVKGYKLLSKSYKNCYTKIKVQCDKGHKYEVIYNSFKQGHKCPVCDAEKTSSKVEKEIFEIVKFLTNENIITNNRTQIVNLLTGYNLELDIWIPKLKKAIEFNGNYWHNSEYSKYKDNEKVKQCKEKGINLLVIQEQEWIDNKSNCIEQIKNWINN